MKKKLSTILILCMIGTICFPLNVFGVNNNYESVTTYGSNFLNVSNKYDYWDPIFSKHYCLKKIGNYYFYENRKNNCFYATKAINKKGKRIIKSQGSSNIDIFCSNGFNLFYVEYSKQESLKARYYMLNLKTLKKNRILKNYQSNNPSYPTLELLSMYDDEIICFDEFDTYKYEICAINVNTNERRTLIKTNDYSEKRSSFLGRFFIYATGYEDEEKYYIYDMKTNSSKILSFPDAVSSKNNGATFLDSVEIDKKGNIYYLLEDNNENYYLCKTTYKGEKYKLLKTFKWNAKYVKQKKLCNRPEIYNNKLVYSILKEKNGKYYSYNYQYIFDKNKSNYINKHRVIKKIK